MYKTVSVDEALSKGDKMVTYPGMSIMFGIIGISSYLGTQEILPTWSIGVGVLLSIILSWFYWSIMITKWKIWAFENVRNVHELKRKAFLGQLIWPDGSIFGKTEIQTTKQKEKIKSLQLKFNLEDIFEDDLTIPNETIIYYSSAKNYIQLIVWIGIFVLSVYLLFTGNYVYGILFLILGGYFSYKEYAVTSITNPQIILNEKGISANQAEFFNWNEIEYIEVVHHGIGNDIKYYLTYKHPNGTVEIGIDNLETTPDEVDNFLKIYKGRYEKIERYKTEGNENMKTI